MRTAFWQFAILLLAGLQGLGQDAAGLSYTNPPEWVVWIEGEDALSSNWIPGESRHNWWHEYAGVSGRGLLDLASPELPAEGAFVATYEFDLPAAGTYELYWRGRYPGYQACPIHWSVNGGPEHRQPALGASHEAGILHAVVNVKLVLADLGPFPGVQGRNRLTVSIRDVLRDNVAVPPAEAGRQESYAVQAIDSLLVARVQYRQPPERLRAVAVKEAPEAAPLVLTAEMDPAAAEFAGTWATPVARDWRGYERLSVSLRVTSPATEPFNGRLRCYYEGSTFRDLQLLVPRAEFGQVVTREYELAKEFEGVSRAAIHALWLYTYGAWYAHSGAYRVEVTDVTLCGQNALGRQPLALPPAGRPAPDLAQTKARQMAQFVWNDVPRDDSPTQGESGGLGDALSTAGIPFAAGELAAVFSPVTGGLRRLALGDQTLVDMPAAPAPVQLAFLDGSLWSPASPGTWEPHDTALVFRRGDALASIELRLMAEAGEIRCRPLIVNHAPQPIARVRFTLWPGARLKGTLLASTQRLSPGTYDSLRTMVSPQAFVHDWFCLYDGQVTLHGRLEDPFLLDSRGRCGCPASGAFVEVDKFPCIRPGQSWAAPDLVIGADSTGTWYAAADRFRLWFDSWARRPPIPPWFQAIGGLSVGGQVYEEQAIASNRAMLGQARDLGGVTLFHTGAWLPLLTEAWYPLNYRLDAGQLARLAAVTNDLRAQGGRLSIYTNALMFSRVTADYAAYGKDLTVIGSDGFPVYTEHDHRHHPMALPWPNAEWAERFCTALEPVIAEGRPDMLYLDQLGAVPTHLDYALERHRHTHYGEWRRVQAEFCEVAERRFRPLQPELATGIECPNIAAQQFVTFALLVHSSFDILRYTFPHFVSFIGAYAGGLAPETVRRYAKEAFLSGQPLLFFDCAATGLDETTRTLVREMLQMKREIDPRLYGLRCQTARGIVAAEGVEAFGFVGDRQWLITYVKTGPAASLRLDPAAFGCPDSVHARVLAPAGAEVETLPVQEADGMIELRLPAATFGLLELH